MMTLLIIIIALALIPAALVGLVYLAAAAYVLRFAIPAAIASLITLGWLIFFQPTFWREGGWIAGLIALFFIYKTLEQINPTPYQPPRPKSAVASNPALILSVLFFAAMGLSLGILGFYTYMSDNDSGGIGVAIFGGVIFVGILLLTPAIFRGAARQRAAEHERREPQSRSRVEVEYQALRAVPAGTHSGQAQHAHVARSHPERKPRRQVI
jgi:hypothetical protein